MTNAEKDQAIRRYMRKVATHALNALQETREEFMRKYLHKYHQKMQEQADKREAVHKAELEKKALDDQLINERNAHVTDDFARAENLEREKTEEEERVMQRKIEI